MWKEVRVSHIYQCASLLEAGTGRGEFLVASRGEIFETVQLLVCENLPPCAFRQVGRRFGRLPLCRVDSGFTESHGDSIRSRERRRPAIIRTHTATCYNQARGNGGKD